MLLAVDQSNAWTLLPKVGMNCQRTGWLGDFFAGKNFDDRQRFFNLLFCAHDRLFLTGQSWQLKQQLLLDEKKKLEAHY